MASLRKNKRRRLPWLWSALAYHVPRLPSGGSFGPGYSFHRLARELLQIWTARRIGNIFLWTLSSAFAWLHAAMSEGSTQKAIWGLQSNLQRYTTLLLSLMPPATPSQKPLGHAVDNRIARPAFSTCRAPMAVAVASTNPFSHHFKISLSTIEGPSHWLRQSPFSSFPH